MVNYRFKQETSLPTRSFLAFDLGKTVITEKSEGVWLSHFCGKLDAVDWLMHFFFFFSLEDLGFAELSHPLLRVEIESSLVGQNQKVIVHQHQEKAEKRSICRPPSSDHIS